MSAQTSTYIVIELSFAYINSATLQKTNLESTHVINVSILTV